MTIARIAASVRVAPGARIAPWVALAVMFLAGLSLALSAPAHAQGAWPAPAKGPGKFPDANPPAAGPGQFPPANAAAPGQFPAANAPQSLPQQPGAVPPPSQWGNANAGQAAAQHPAWGGGGGGMSRGAPPCAAELMPLRDEAQKKGMALKAGIDRKAERSEICKMFKTFVSAESKFVKYAVDNGSRCGISTDDVKVIKGNHSKSVTARNQVCNAAAGPSAPPPPSLSDALGTSRIPSASNIKTGKGGTFDTLSGSTLQR